jgi:hypothetical protein
VREDVGLQSSNHGRHEGEETQQSGKQASNQL